MVSSNDNDKYLDLASELKNIVELVGDSDINWSCCNKAMMTYYGT